MMTLLGGLSLAGLLALRLASRRAAAAPVPPVAPVLPPNGYTFPLFAPVRGACRTTHEAAYAHLAAQPGPLFHLAGLCFPAREYLNRLLFITGLPGSGKTTLCRLMLASMADLFRALPARAAAGLHPGEGKMRWLVIDPTNAFLPLLYRVLPPDVPVVRLSPQDAGGVAWDVAKDVTSKVMNEAFQKSLFPDSMFQSGDPFWALKGRELSEAVVSVFLHRGSDWELRDLVVPIKYPQYLKPLLGQSPYTRAMTEHELAGRLGRDTIATCSATVNRLATAAAMWAAADRKVSLEEFLDGRSVAHFAFTPALAASLTGVANALSYVLILKAIERGREFDHTVLIGDEAR